MKISFKYNGYLLEADFSKPIDISIPISREDNPNCYWAEEVKFKTITEGDFVGSVAKGGPVNYEKLVITPHGNGTHTECVGHIIADTKATIHHQLNSSHFVCQLLSIEPVKKGDDMIIDFNTFEKLWDDNLQSQAVVIRTLPNDHSKTNRKYSGTNPAYLDAEITKYLNKRGVQHLIVDLPSVDKEVDGGKLAAHKSFWGLPENVRAHATITELAFIDNSIEDGVYLLNLQTLNIEADASPSRPVLFKISGF